MSKYKRILRSLGNELHGVLEAPTKESTFRKECFNANVQLVCQRPCCDLFAVSSWSSPCSTFPSTLFNLAIHNSHDKSMLALISPHSLAWLATSPEAILCLKVWTIRLHQDSTFVLFWYWVVIEQLFDN